MTFLHSIATSVPRHRASQKQAQQFFERVLAAAPADPRRDRALEMAARIYPASGIETRHSVLGDWLEDDAERFTFFPKYWDLEPFPGTAARMARFETESVALVAAAAREALARAAWRHEQVTHLVVSTCTGLFAPGLDVALVDRLGLNPAVYRTMLGFMGCYAGITGMRVSDDIVRAHPEARVLQVAVELCSLHFQKKPRPDLVVANAIFADGAAAATWSGVEGERALARFQASLSVLDPGSRDEMTWRIGDHGFEMSLKRSVPSTLERAAPGFLAELLARAGLTRATLAGFALHPGGVAIIDAVSRALALADRDVATSLDVLREHGNMSSATIFFVLERRLAETDGAIAALGFGPGLAIEGVLLTGLG